MADQVKEIGATGLENFAGSIRDDFLREMRGKEGYKHYNEMRLNSPIISGLLLAIEQPLRSLSWTFAGEDNDPRVDFLEEARQGMSLSWNDHITEVLTMLPFGFSIFEIVYKLNTAGQYVWRKFAPRGQDTVNKWLYDVDGGLAGFEQVCAPAYMPTPLPIDRLVLYRTRVERGSPEGRSILRAAWIPYYYAKHVSQFEAIGLERGMDGFPVITLPANSNTSETDTNSDYSKAAKMVRNIRNDEQAGIVLPSPDWTLELLAPGAQSRLDPDKVIRRYESRMLMAALAQFLMLGQESVGSLALSKDQTDFFTMSINSVADNIAETFTKYAIPRILALNGFDPEGVKLEHTPPGDTDLTALADFLQKTGSYFNWSAEDEVWLRQVGGLPERDAVDIQADIETRNEARDAALAALKEKANAPAAGDGPGMLPPADTAKMMADFFAANPPDERKRKQAEREWKQRQSDFFGKQMKRVLKAAKEMRG